MGRVYLAKDVRLNRLVALKILSQERMNNPRAIARFQREAKVGAQLQHENLVRVYDEGESGGVRYLVMEYIEGKNVGQLIGELGAIPWPTAARLGPPGRPGAGPRPAQGADPPRRQPLQHPGHPGRHGQADRPGPGHRPERPGQRDPRRRHRRHVRLRLARAGQALAVGRHPGRHLLAGLHALSHDRRPGAVPGRQPAREALRPPAPRPRPADRAGARACPRGWPRSSAR